MIVYEDPVEQLEVVVGEVGTRSLEAILEAAIEVEHLFVEAIEVLGVACLIDLLGEQERLLVLVLGGEHESRELARHALFTDEECRQSV